MKKQCHTYSLTFSEESLRILVFVIAGLKFDKYDSFQAPIAIIHPSQNPNLPFTPSTTRGTRRIPLLSITNRRPSVP